MNRCFPVVPKLACQHLGISISPETSSRPITVLGGLNSFGGAGANYSMHVSFSSRIPFGEIFDISDTIVKAVAEVVRRLRKMRLSNPGGQANNGLILANGGVLTSENAICLSTHKRVQFPYPIYTNNSPVHRKRSDRDDVPPVSSSIAGEVIVEVSDLFTFPPG